MLKIGDSEKNALLTKDSVKSDLEKMIELNNQIMLLSKKEIFGCLDEELKQTILIQQKCLKKLNDSYEILLEKQKNVQKEVKAKKKILNECLKEIGIDSRTFEKKYLEDTRIQSKLVEYARTTDDKRRRNIIIEKLKIIDKYASEEFVELMYAALLNNKYNFNKALKKCDLNRINDSYYLQDSVFLDMSTNLLIRIIEIGNYTALTMFLSLEGIDVNILKTLKRREFIFNNPIVKAVKLEDEKKLRLLFKNKADANISNDPYFKLPIYYAVETGNHDIFEILARETKFSSLNKKMCLEEKSITYLEYISSKEDKFYYELIQKIFERQLSFNKFYV